MTRTFKPSVTVAAIVEQQGRFLLVEEVTSDGIRINQPAGHLDPGESLQEAAIRETLEETAYRFTPTHVLGTYVGQGTNGVTYVRFAFVGSVEGPEQRPLDRGILRALWLTPEQMRARAADLRSVLVMRCVDDYLRGQRFPLDSIFTHPNIRLADGTAR